MPDPICDEAAASDPELAALRATVARLERELVEQAADANRTIADAQKRMFWLDELQIDLDNVLARPFVAPVVVTSIKGVRRLRREAARLRRRGKT
jgi:hypothetical protein